MFTKDIYIYKYKYIYKYIYIKWFVSETYTMLIFFINPFISLDRPLGLQEIEAPRISRKLAHKGDTVVSPTDWPPLPP